MRRVANYDRYVGYVRQNAQNVFDRGNDVNIDRNRGIVGAYRLEQLLISSCQQHWRGREETLSELLNETSSRITQG